MGISDGCVRPNNVGFRDGSMAEKGRYAEFRIGVDRGRSCCDAVYVCCEALATWRLT